MRNGQIVHKSAIIVITLLLAACANPTPTVVSTRTPVVGGGIAEWDSRARTVADAAAEADLIIYGKVIAEPVTRIRNFESPQMDANGTPDGTVHVTTIPFADTLFEVVKTYMGEAPEQLLVMQTGGVLSNGNTSQIRDDPLYQLGDEYVLFLVDISGDEIHAPDRELYRTISPVGRYLIVGNSATSPAEEYMNQLLPTTFDELERQIAEAVSTPQPKP
jgi:hypothetical protein